MAFLNNIFGKKEEDISSDKIFQEEAFDVRDIIAPPYIGVLQDHIKLGERFAKSFFVFFRPRASMARAKSRPNERLSKHEACQPAPR